MSSTIALSKAERRELSQRSTSQAGRADEARRARLILLLDEGRTWGAIRDKLDCTDSFIARWGKRFAAERLIRLVNDLLVMLRQRLSTGGSSATAMAPADIVDLVASPLRVLRAAGGTLR